VSSGIAAERRLLEELKGQADVVVDTSVLNVHELRDHLQDVFSSEAKPRLQANIVSFGYKHGLRATSISSSTAASSPTRTGSRSCAR